MNSLLKLMTLICLAIPAYGATGFSAGSEFKNHRIQGPITVRCNDGRESRISQVTCRASYLSPTMRSKFSYDSGVAADKVKITYTNSRGKNKTKSSKVKQAESTRSFNLWIRTLTQRPLLKSGQNELSYKLYKKGSVVESGEFTVNVETQPVRYCPYRSYYSSSINDCTNSMYICDRYFREHNDCQ
jgi:hypothetical protein